VRQRDILLRQLTHRLHFLCVKAKILGVNDSLTPLNANAGYSDKTVVIIINLKLKVAAT